MSNTCHMCGQTLDEASVRGAWFIRVNKKGVPGIWECRPNCDQVHGDQDDALLGALDIPEFLRRPQ